MRNETVSKVFQSIYLSIYWKTWNKYELLSSRQLLIKKYRYCFSTGRALALNNPQRLICQNNEIKTIQTQQNQ